MPEKLSQALIKELPTTGKAYDVRDSKTRGLICRVEASGSRSFYVEFKRGKRARIGPCDRLTLERARREAVEQLSRYHLGQRTRLDDVRERRAASLGEFLAGDYADHCRANMRTAEATLHRLRLLPWQTMPPGQITAADVERWRATRVKKVKPQTANRDLADVRAMFNRAMALGLIEANPCAFVRPVRVDQDERERYLSDVEYTRLVAAIEAREERLGPDHLGPIVLLALNTGARRGELFSLHWADVDLERGLMTIRAASAKSRKTRRVPLNKTALAVLRRWRGDEHRAGLVFPGPNGGRLGTIKTAWGKLMRAAKIEDFRFHDCRHTAASRLRAAGVDSDDIRRVLGHGSLAMTSRYEHLSDDFLAGVMSKLEG